MAHDFNIRHSIRSPFYLLSDSIKDRQGSFQKDGENLSTTKIIQMKQLKWLLYFNQSILISAGQSLRIDWSKQDTSHTTFILTRFQPYRAVMKRKYILTFYFSYTFKLCGQNILISFFPFRELNRLLQELYEIKYCNTKRKS